MSTFITSQLRPIRTEELGAAKKSALLLYNSLYFKTKTIKYAQKLNYVKETLTILKRLIPRRNIKFSKDSPEIMEPISNEIEEPNP